MSDMLLLFVRLDTGGCTMRNDTGKLRSLHLLQLPCCADIKPIMIAALHGDMLWLTLSWSHAFAWDPEDAISRKHKLHLEHEKYIVKRQAQTSDA